MSATRTPVQGKVIRIGVVQDGRIVQERRLGHRESLTVGASPRATVSCPLPALPRRFPLIEHHAGRYRLRLPRDVSGKLCNRGRVYTLDELRKQETPHRGTWVVDLDDQARGSIRLGERTLLFQLVQAPPVGMRELERPSFRPKLMNQDDPVFMGFLGLFTVMAGMFAAYVSAVQTPELVTDFQEVERFAVLHLPPPEPIEIKPEPAPPPVNDGAGQPVPPKPTPKPEVADAGEPQPGEVRRPRTAEEAMAFEARRKAELERRVMEESALLKALIIATTGESKNGFLSRSSVFDRDGELDLDVANKDGHRLEAGIGWKKGAGTGIGRDDIEIDPLVMIEGGQAGITGAEQVEPPTGRVTFGPVAEPEGGPDATRVRTAVRGYYGRVKVCYERRLKEIPSLAGRVEIAWVVNGGKATEIYVLENTTDDAQLERCIVTSMSRWAFPADIVDFELSYPFVLAPG